MPKTIEYDNDTVTEFLLNRVQCMRDVNGYLSDRIEVLAGDYDLCCPSSSSESSSSSSSSSSTSSSSSSSSETTSSSSSSSSSEESSSSSSSGISSSSSSSSSSHSSSSSSSSGSSSSSSSSYNECNCANMSSTLILELFPPEQTESSVNPLTLTRISANAENGSCVYASEELVLNGVQAGTIRLFIENFGTNIAVSGFTFPGGSLYEQYWTEEGMEPGCPFGLFTEGSEGTTIASIEIAEI